MESPAESDGDFFADVNPGPARIVAALTPADWAELTALVDDMNAHRGSFGAWIPPRRVDETTMALGYSTFGPLLENVFDFAYARGLVMSALDWGSWLSASPERLHLDQRDRFASLSIEHTLGLITALFRRDRFVEGALLEAFDDRTVPLLFKRLLDFRNDQHIR